MKRLCLLRHAKSEQGLPDQDDFVRVLNKRGIQAAKYMAGFIMRSPYTPDAVLCSTAARAVETFAPLAELLPRAVSIQYDRKLYHASRAVLLKAIHDAADASTLLMVGHNPGLEDLALSLSDDPESHLTHDIGLGLPTAGFVAIDFNVDSWKEVAPNGGHIVFFGRPRVLMDAPTH